MAGHLLEIRSKNDSTVRYHLEAGTIEPARGLTREDRVRDGRIADGAVP